MWGAPDTFEVTREQLRAYAAATNDNVPAHIAGDRAPAAFAVVAAFASMTTAVAGVVSPKLLRLGVHGEQDLYFHRPIQAGTVLHSRAAPVGFRPRSSGVTALVRAETRTEDGDLVVEQLFTCFLRGAHADAAVGELAPDHAFPESLRASPPLGAVAQTFDADQTFRYADASGDRVAMHLDGTAARAAGHPGIIIHGLCTLAFVTRAVIQSTTAVDSGRLRRIAMRFSKPCLPGQTITTGIWRASDERAWYAFETTTSDGQVVIRDGWAELG